MNILEVCISSYSKTTKLMDEIFDIEKKYTRVIFKDAFYCTLKYKIFLVCDLEKDNVPYNWDVPHYYYTMTQLKSKLNLNAIDKTYFDMHNDYGMEEEVGTYLKNDEVKTDCIVPFRGKYEIQGQRTADYQSGGWGNYPNPTLTVVGFIVKTW